MFAFLDFEAGVVRHKHKTNEVLPGLEEAEEIKVCFLSRGDSATTVALYVSVIIRCNGEIVVTKGGLHYCQEAGKCDCGTPPPVVIKIETDRRDETVWDEGKIISPRPPDGPDCRE